MDRRKKRTVIWRIGKLCDPSNVEWMVFLEKCGRDSTADGGVNFVKTFFCRVPVVEVGVEEFSTKSTIDFPIEFVTNCKVFCDIYV